MLQDKSAAYSDRICGRVLDLYINIPGVQEERDLPARRGVHRGHQEWKPLQLQIHRAKWQRLEIYSNTQVRKTNKFNIASIQMLLI